MGTDGTASLDEYLKPLTEHKALIALVTLVVTALGIVAAFVLPARYEATAVVLVNPVSSEPTDTVESNSEADMETELRLVSSNAVLDLASQQLASQGISSSAADLDANMTASNPRDSRIIDISFQAGSPEAAQAGANSVAESYLAYRAELAGEATRAAVEVLNQQVSDLKEELTAVESAIADSRQGSRNFIAATIEQSVLSGNLDAQLAALADLNTISSNVGTVVDPAQQPTSTSGLGFIPIVIGALIGGLVLGCIAAFALSAIRGALGSDGRGRSVQGAENTVGRHDSSGRRTHLTVSDRLDDQPAPEVSTASLLAGEESAVEQPALHETPAATPMTEATAAEQPTAEEIASEQSASELLEQLVPDQGATTADEMPVPEQLMPRTSAAVNSTPPASEPRSAHPLLLPNQPLPDRYNPPEYQDTDIDTPTSALSSADPSAPSRLPSRIGASPAVPGSEFKNETPLEPPMPPVSTVPAPDSLTASKGDGPKQRLRPQDASELVVHPDYTRVLSVIRRLSQEGTATCVAVGESSREESLAVGLGLTEALQDSGARVLIIDMILDDPGLHKLVDQPVGPGLTDVLAGRADLAQTMTEAAVSEGLLVLVAGTGTDDPMATQALLTSDNISNLVDQADGLVHAIVFLGGNIADAAARDAELGSLGGLVVGTGQYAGMSVGERTGDELNQFSSSVLGIVSISEALTAAEEATGASDPAHV